jgi:hypothetical protein
MSGSMLLSDDHRVVPADDVVSPELVLVDEALASRVRSRLESPHDTLARIESLPHPEPRARAAAAAPTVRPPTTSAVSRGRRRPSSRRTRTGILVGVCVVVAVAVGSSVRLVALDPNGTVSSSSADKAPPETVDETPPVSRPSPASELPGETTPASRGTDPRGTPQGDRPQSGQRFAWAPVPGASGYHAELFEGSALVYAADTAQPQMVVPAVWKHAGKQRRLEPGEYRWLVWAVVAGVRQAQAVVQAELVIPAR